MSYGIVRVQKMSGGSVKGIEIHDRREKKGISHTNKDIDWGRTHQNYDLHPNHNVNFTKAVKKRISELNLPKAVRKDAVVMAQVLVTSDHDFFTGLSKGQQEQFFKDSYNFLAERYGKENVVSATVHLDERTPHMHLNFVPVTADGRLSAKSLLTRQSLIEQQTAFQAKVGKHYGLERGLQGGKKKHLDVLEYKAVTAADKLSMAQNVLRDTEYALIPVKAEYEAKKAYIDECDKASNISQAMPDYAQEKEKGLMKKKLYVLVPKEKWKEKHVSSQEKTIQKERDQVFEAQLSSFYKTPSGAHIKQLENKIKDLEKENQELKNKNYDLVIYSFSNNTKKHLNKALERMPIQLQRKFDEAWKDVKNEEQKNKHKNKEYER